MKKLLITVLVLLPAAAAAHVGDHSLLDWKTGFLHPLTGPDHLLALLATGVWLAQSDRRAQWVSVTGFAALLALAIVAGSQFSSATFEMGILATLVALGALLACAVHGSILLRTLVTAATAAIHGFVHGTELPVADGAALFAVTLVLSSVALIGAALLAGRLLQAFAKGMLARAAGILLMGFAVVAALV